MAWFKKTKGTLSLEERLDAVKKATIPEHVAIIMDGNGRWAKARRLPRIAGHRQGMENVRLITRLADEIGVKFLTLYAFSTENWRRSKEEVSGLMKMPEEFLNKFLPELINQNVRVITIGEKENVPTKTIDAINNAVIETKENSGLVLNFAFNYGSRREMVLAVQRLVNDLKNGKIKGNVTEQLLSNYLMTAALPDPDLLIRTSGEFRLSNFMLWQLAYTEIHFAEVLWPQFREAEFLQAIEDFQSRSRRFGGRKGDAN